MATFGARQGSLDEPAAGATAVEADVGPAVDVAGVGRALEAEAGTAALAGRNSGPFCPQPASSAAPHSNSKAGIMRRRMQAIRIGQVAAEYKGAGFDGSGPGAGL